jgi:hypothetical protein
MNRHKKVLASSALAAVLALSAAGCTSSGHSQEAAAAASSLAANPAVKNAEATLKANFAKDFLAAHPVTSLENVLKETFPGANSTDIVTYGLKTFTLKARHRGPAQDVWFQGVVLFALNKNAAGVPSGAASAPIPGVTASVPAPSPSKS